MRPLPVTTINMPCGMLIVGHLGRGNPQRPAHPSSP
jgi:hypothetical protein